MSGDAGVLRFAILCHGPSLPAWQAECIRHLLHSGVAGPVLLLIAPRAEQPVSPRLRGLFYRLYEKFWLKRRLKAFRPIDLSPLLSHLPTIACPRDKAAIRGHDLDFILQFVTAVDDELPPLARHGVWRYEGDGATRCPGRAAFWELYYGVGRHRAVLVRLADPSHCVVLHQGCFATHWSHSAVVDRVLFGASEWCVRACREIGLARMSGECRPPASLDRAPSNAEFLTFLAARAGNFAHAAFRHFFLVEDWNIGIVAAPVTQIIASGRPAAVRWLPQPRSGHYHADPFALDDGSDIVLCEDYGHAGGKGRIAAIDASADCAGATPIESFASADHRSYPYLFTAGGTVYCIPESAENRCVELFRAERFPDRWQRVVTLVADFPALDSTVFPFAGRWWLFCTSADEGSEHKLHAWHADMLLGPWQPHPLNPLKCDVASSRPAGPPFLIAGELHRPSQDCSRTYGGAITINRIVTLTPTDFAEIPAGRVDPPSDGPYRSGLHTLCPLGDRTIIDGKRFFFDVRASYLKRAPRRRAGHARRRRIAALEPVMTDR